MPKLAAVSIDLDEIDNYTAIHGLSGSLQVPPNVVYDKAVPRYRALFRELGIPATFFAIGRDLSRKANAEHLRELVRDGHEIGNHSLSHWYDLTRRSREAQRNEVRGGADAIESAVGIRPTGFRAPGYTITDRLFDVLGEEGVAYDSSVFPCPGYYAPKSLIIKLLSLRGKPSRSVIDDPRVLMAPADPYRIGKPYYRRGAGLLELPIGVTSNWTLRLPYIGTNVMVSGAFGARLWTKLAAARPFVNLELHGLDLCDAVEDGLQALAPHQPDLRRTEKNKRAALIAAVAELKKQGYRFVTLAEAAQLVV